jgi:subtilase family serine protease
MLAASPLTNVVCSPNVSFFAGSGFSVYSPNQIRHAYGFDQVGWNGAGQTIAIVDAYDDPTVLTDVQKFDRQWGLADPKLTVAKMTSGGRAPIYNSGWAMEIALDVEWAHAIAPGASILLVEATTASLGDLLSAVNYARNQIGISVVSMSWGTGEFSSEGSLDSYFTTPAGHSGVTFVASSGDSGAPASWPAISSNVLAVGGTTLTLGAGSSYYGEKGWSGSGGGYSPYISEPSFQRGFQNTGRRSNPDVAYDADPYSGFYVCSNGGWYAVGGTSAGAPQWAALIAIADQGRAAAGKAPLNSALQAVYSLAAADFHDITTGSNGYSAGVGYDAVTGRGSPVANLVIRDLVAYGAAMTVSSSLVGGTSTSQLTVGGAVNAVTGVGDGSLAISRMRDQPTIAGFGEQNASTLSDIQTTANTIGNRLSMMTSIRMAWNSTALIGDQATAPDRISTPDAAGEESGRVPDAAFESSASSSRDPLGLLDRVERLLDRHFESDAMLPTANNAGFSRNGLDACLVDGQWVGRSDGLTDSDRADVDRTQSRTIVPLAAMTLGATIGGGSRTPRREREVRLPRLRGSS